MTAIYCSQNSIYTFIDFYQVDMINETQTKIIFPISFFLSF